MYNRYLKRYLQEKGIKICYALNETNANFAERYIQTLTKRLYRYFTHTQKHKYINILQDVVMSINETPNRSLNGRAPASVDAENESEVRLNAYLVRRKAQKKRLNIKKSSKRKRTAYTLKIGDQVRISHLRRQFQRDYDQTFTEEIFIVSYRFVSQGIPIYKIKDMMNEPIQGSFNASDLQKVSKDEQTQWRIEKIIRKRKVRGKPEVLVRWLGWPKKFDSWIPEIDVKNI